MRKSKKLVSLLLAVVLAFSCVAGIASFSASAADDGKFAVTVDSNFFPERTERFSAEDDIITVSYYIKSNQMMYNSQWNLYFDPEVLAVDETDGVNFDYYVDPDTGETEMLSNARISPVAAEYGAIINTGKIAFGEIHGNNSNANPVYALKTSSDSKVGFITVTFKVLDPTKDTTVELELVELLTNKGQIYKFSSPEEGVDLTEFETQSSVYTGTYNPDYVNPEKTPDYMIGDVNFDGSVDVLDAVIIHKYTVDKTELDVLQEYVADVNDDENIDVLDALDIQKYCVDKISEFTKK